MLNGTTKVNGTTMELRNEPLQTENSEVWGSRSSFGDPHGISNVKNNPPLNKTRPSI